MLKAILSNSFTHKIIVVGFISILIPCSVFGLFPSLLVQIQCSSDVNKSSEARKVLEASVNYEHLWDFETSFIAKGAVKSIDNLVVFSDGDCRRVVALNIESGDNAWTYSYGFPKRISADSTRGYIYVYILGNNELVALNKAGEQVWKNETLRGKRGGIIPYTLSEGNLVAYIPSRRFVQVNPDTGEFGENISLPDTFFVIGGEHFWQVYNGQLIARDSQFVNSPWRSEYQGLTQCCLEQVEVLPDLILLRFVSEIIALDRERGQLLWRFSEDDVVSNFAVVDNRVFFLDVNAKLSVLETSSGQVLETIQFAPPNEKARNISNSGHVIGSSKLVATDDIVAVYFGDTHILSAYRINFEDGGSE